MLLIKDWFTFMTLFLAMRLLFVSGRSGTRCEVETQPEAWPRDPAVSLDGSAPAWTSYNWLLFSLIFWRFLKIELQLQHFRILDLKLLDPRVCPIFVLVFHLTVCNSKVLANCCQKSLSDLCAQRVVSVNRMS